MNGPQHYAMAERLLKRGMTGSTAEAQVHALLAQVAIQVDANADILLNEDKWREVTRAETRQ